ncbi:hypothetical protein K438DRAFT_2019536 [Mycena galopus ATCC 62051]|nr:hypothetical protein K438DRAFT_2019536 [Mycena galopus ATCC 62051]
MLPYARHQMIPGVNDPDSNAHRLPSFSLPDHPHGQVSRLQFHPPSTPYEPRSDSWGPSVDQMSAEHVLTGRYSSLVPVQSARNPHASQSRVGPLDWTGHASSSHTPAENDYFPGQNHSIDPELSQAQPRHTLKPNTGSHRMIHENPAFPWNRPFNTPATSIHGGTFIGGDLNTIQRQAEDGLHILHRAIAGDAFYDSAERYPQPRCHPDTRTKLLDVLCNWVHGIEPPRKWSAGDSLRPLRIKKRLHQEKEDGIPEGKGPSSAILWLYGPAGAGKSALAQSLCERVHGEGRLGGSFFFKRGHLSRGNANKLFATIAYQLALHVSPLKQPISQAIENDPSILDRSISNQLQSLIIEPCRKCSLSQPISIIIDGLDECEGQNIQQEVLRSIGNAVSQNLPILFFIASRPESHIRETFGDPCLNDVHRPLNIQQSFRDVHKYLLDEFARIHREHQTMVVIPTPWPHSDIIDDLVYKSSGYFIYASTVVKFIDDKRFRPVDRLDIVLGIKSDISESPFHTIDELYRHILNGVPITFRPQLLTILTVIGARSEFTVSHIERLLEFPSGEVRLVLRDLHSVIKLPPTDDHPWFNAVHHLSFLDFLNDRSRSGPFHVDRSQCQTSLARRILKAFEFHNGDSFLTARNVTCSPTAFRDVISAEPSPDLLPLVRLLNPFFLFCPLDKSDPGVVSQRVLEWLKKFNPPPEDLIQLWEDYVFMESWDTLCDDPGSSKKPQSTTFNDALAQASPQSIRVLYVSKLFLNVSALLGYRLARIHLLLGLSWGELRAAVACLRGLLGDNAIPVHKLMNFNSDAVFLQSLDSSSLLLDLAKGSLRAMQATSDGRSSLDWGADGCGFFIRSCPPSHELLHNVSEIRLPRDPPGQGHDWYNSPRPADLHNILQWLKIQTFPESPAALITRLEHSLKVSMEPIRWPQMYGVDELERQWVNWREKHKGYLPQCTVHV